MSAKENRNKRTKLLTLMISTAEQEELRQISNDAGISIACMIRDSIPFFRHFYARTKPASPPEKGETA